MIDTLDAPVNSESCWVFTLPDDPSYTSLFMGALAVLTRAGNYRQQGSMTPLEMASFFSKVLVEQRQLKCMIGSIIPAVWAAAPDGYLLCDGHTELKQDYPRLYALLPSELILDADTFILPDLSGKVLMGAGELSGETFSPFTDYGANSGSITVENLPGHTHDIAPHDHTTIPHSHIDAGHFHSLSLPTFLAIEPGEAPTYTPIGLPTPTLPTLPGFANLIAETVVVNSNLGQTTDNGTGEGKDISRMQASYAVKYFMVAK